MCDLNTQEWKGALQSIEEAYRNAQYRPEWLGLPPDHDLMLTDEELKQLNRATKSHATWREWWDDVYWTHRSFLHPANDLLAIGIGIVWHAAAVYGLYCLARLLI